METTFVPEKVTDSFISKPAIAYQTRKIPRKWEGFIVRLWAKLGIVWLALKAHKSVRKARVALGHFIAFKKMIVGGYGKRKLTAKNGKYGFGLYVPPFPSHNFDRFVHT